jgi:hypothetical protein
VTAEETEIRQRIQELQEQLAHANLDEWRVLVREINLLILRIKILPKFGT